MNKNDIFQPERPDVLNNFNDCKHDCGRPSLPPIKPNNCCAPPHDSCGPKPNFVPGYNPCMPQINPVPPVPSPIEGSSLYESMDMLTNRVNLCIEQWNCISKNCYEALHKVVEAARSNDVYYDDCEVHYQAGYDEIEGAAYSIVEKKAVDKKGDPIFVKLYPAYNNTSNPGVKQKIFDASFINSANVIITAVQASDNTWGGPAMINGSQIPGTSQETGYVYGFTKRGSLRYFPYNTNPTTLCQQGMVDVIGGCIPVVYDGKVVDDIPDPDTKKSITAIGFNSGNGSVFFFSCSAQTEPGITLKSCGRILTEYGCTVGVVTSATINETTAQSSEGMLYLGQMTTEPIQAIQPENVAYWVVSKKRCFQNKFEKEVADLVQTTGRNAWQTYLLGVQIQSFDDRITANYIAIQKEIERATNAENVLQENIDAETNRAKQAENILNTKIEDETKRALTAEDELNKKIQAETDRATAEELSIRSDLNDEILRATNREREIQSALDSEIAKRIAADNDIINSIEQETLARKASDEELRTLIEKLVAQTNTKITTLETTIDGIVSGKTNLPYLKLTGGNLTGNVTMASSTTITVGRGPTENMEVATKQYVDDAVASGAGPGSDVSKEYVDQQVSNLQNQLNDKVNKTGDTMSGSLNMDGNKIEEPVLSSNTSITVDNGADGPGMITNLKAPSNDLDATNKQYVDSSIENVKSSIENELSGKFLPISGGNMTGDINMTGNSVVSFYDEIQQTNKLTRSGTVDSQKEQGSIYNDSNSMVVKSENGSVTLIGTELNLTNGSGENIDIYGATRIYSVYNDPSKAAINMQDNTIRLQSGSIIVGAKGNATGIINTGSVIFFGDNNQQSAIFPHNGHLDINVEDSAGSVYINRWATSGGTGEIHLTEIHAPNELRLSPGTNVNMLSHRITNLSPATNNSDAVNLSQLNDVASNGFGLTNWKMLFDHSRDCFVILLSSGYRYLSTSWKWGGTTLYHKIGRFSIESNGLYVHPADNVNPGNTILEITFNQNFSNVTAYPIGSPHNSQEYNTCLTITNNVFNIYNASSAVISHAIAIEPYYSSNLNLYPV